MDTFADADLRREEQDTRDRISTLRTCAKCADFHSDVLLFLYKLQNILPTAQTNPHLLPTEKLTHQPPFLVPSYYLLVKSFQPVRE